MKGITVMLAMLFVSGMMAFAQGCPPGYPQPLTPVTGNIPPIGATVPSDPCMIVGSTPAVTTTAVSPDTTVVLNQIAALRADVQAMALVQQGQMLTSRMNQLMAQEQAFRQALIANPNLLNAQLIALQLSADAVALNRDITAFTRQLSLIPVAQRPLMATTLNTFDVVYWQPTTQAFNMYYADWPTVAMSYQPAFAQNPWLQTWTTSYQTALTPIAQNQQVIASVRWWNQPVVLGSMETFPGTMPYGTTMVLPSGAVIFIPANVAAGTTTMGTTSY